MFKILNGYENIESNIVFEIKESKITRGHNYKLVKKQSRLDVRKYSFSQRTINVWNNLSTDCVHASSVNMFKNIIDQNVSRKAQSLVTIPLTESCVFFRHKTITPPRFQPTASRPRDAISLRSSRLRITSLSRH